ncbi:biotin-dependent carboxyltransferase family protein [Alkalihalobacillus oceani]|uniref:Biotin-dependent carboxyltransferase family protein n=1 Tax=Halalkalibacter oceani TaxID=1653776 RepID=A0A9X2DNN2_9BACI|nr:biotin-dependent carboxyltransferase family protein [Halalkalibacter oceani]MCM3714249.1 biotin-dependent carboxyltransferase family protein [Halalkalibacter oceani]
MSIVVKKPGLLTTVQDKGRTGFQKFGIIASGAMDRYALRAANVLVENEEHEAALEITLVGPTLTFEEDALIAICGADLSPTIDKQPLPMWRAVFVRGGTTLSFGPAKHGTRAYLAVAGGYDIPEVMNSRSTYLRAGIGGYEGRALKANDQLYIRKAEQQEKQEALRQRAGERPFYEATLPLFRYIRPFYEMNPLIRVVKGMQADSFEQESIDAFYREPFKVLPQSDRMGFRLAGPPLRLKHKEQLLSEAVTFGSIQVPSGGNPIVLMADRQTTGGYHKIAQVITVDLPVMAQLNLGAEVRFKEVSLEEAQLLLLEQELNFEQLKQGVRLYNKGMI